MKELKPKQFPLSEESPEPTVTVTITKLSPLVLSACIQQDQSTGEPTAASTADRTVEIRGDSKLSRTFQCVDENGSVQVILSGPVLAFGHWKITFPEGSAVHSHDIELRPVGAFSNADIFVVDSIPYFWTVGRRVEMLHKVVNNARKPIAQFDSNRAKDGSGVLRVDGEEIDVLLAVATCVATTKRIESFRK